MEQRDASQTPESTQSQPVDTPPVGPQSSAARPDDADASEPRPRSLLARLKLFAYRTTLGRTRQGKSDV